MRHVCIHHVTIRPLLSGLMLQSPPRGRYVHAEPFLIISLPYTFFLLNGDLALNRNRQLFIENIL